jgi:hypothetical protein
MPLEFASPRRSAAPGSVATSRAATSRAVPDSTPAAGAPTEQHEQVVRGVHNAVPSPPSVGGIMSSSQFPWELDPEVPPDRPAPPTEYAAASASAAERARFRGVRKVNTPLARESNATEPGGVLSQVGFAEAPARRWDDQMFENRLKHALGNTNRRKIVAPSPRSARGAPTRGRV